MLSGTPSEGVGEKDVPVGGVLVLSAARAVVNTDAGVEVGLLDDVEDASIDERERELIRHRTEASVWLPLAQVVY